MGAEPYVSALVSKEGVEMISVAYVCQYTPDEIVKLVDPSKAQDVIERKYTDIISEEKYIFLVVTCAIIKKKTTAIKMRFN